eukprot:CAMPEP_0169286910 /NCGR_PEP_ID=MMETSP1016-20121227/59582_1 /TAXON_ID=342587 /ORGANISM="Karlodinium micrum, Strain CCMP2283" /LENGTH=262 /DNA_ID=CAMNT_0009376713 /DNA_START=143 /DNA_END=932 /DNA_ORIENTATION=-
MPMPFQKTMPGATQSVPAYTSQNTNAFSQPQTIQPQPWATATAPQFMTSPTVSAPLTPKIVQSVGVDGVGVDAGVATAKVIASALGAPTQTSNVSATVISSAKPGMSARELALEARARELESILVSKDRTIQDLEAELAMLKSNSIGAGKRSSIQSPGRKSNFRSMSESKPTIRYSPGDPDDNIDVRLAEYYNSTGSAIQFKRINRGFYRFGETIVELDIVNHKLMARTEDGWNRGKLAPIEKFMTQYENIEREKMGILPDN